MIATFDFRFNSSPFLPSPKAVPAETLGATGSDFLTDLGRTVGRTSLGFLGDLTFFFDLSALTDFAVFEDFVSLEDLLDLFFSA